MVLLPSPPFNTSYWYYKLRERKWENGKTVYFHNLNKLVLTARMYLLNFPLICLPEPQTERCQLVSKNYHRVSVLPKSKGLTCDTTKTISSDNRSHKNTLSLAIKIVISSEYPFSLHSIILKQLFISAHTFEFREPWVMITFKWEKHYRISRREKICFCYPEKFEDHEINAFY